MKQPLGLAVIGCSIRLADALVQDVPTASDGTVELLNTVIGFKSGLNNDTITAGPTVTARTNASDPPAHISQSTPAPIGAIVGGTIGGVALAAFIAFGWLLLAHRRRQKADFNRSAGLIGNAGVSQPSRMRPAGGLPRPPTPTQLEMRQQYEQPDFQTTPPPTGHGADAADNVRTSMIKPSHNITLSVYDPSFPDSTPTSPRSYRQSLGPLPAHRFSTTSADWRPQRASASPAVSPVEPVHEQPQQPPLGTCHEQGRARDDGKPGEYI